jgi:hypothetical protein
MPDLFLIPMISIFDVHDVALRDWLDKLDNESLKKHLESPYGLDRFFPQNSRHALNSADKIHDEVLRLFDTIDPQAVFLEISTDLVELENRYNKRLLSPSGFWSEYYSIQNCEEIYLQDVYCIYIKGIIDRLAKLIENKEHLPLSVVFFSPDARTREELIPVYEDALDKDSEFLLRMANELNEIMNLREKPKNLWYTTMGQKQAAVSYEETEKFYNELTNRLKRLLKFKVREHFVKNLKENAREFQKAYERFLDHKIREEEILLSNILEGINVLTAQCELNKIVILCGPVHYPALFNSLEKEERLKEKGATLVDMDIRKLLELLKPFIQKNRIMQSNYEIALDILGS